MLEILSSSDRVQILFLTAQIIRAEHDTPIMWKLNPEYLDSLCCYMHICSHERLCSEKFLDANIEETSRDSFCVGLAKLYPLLRN